MDSRKFLFTQTGLVFAGEVLCSAAMVGVFALLNRFSINVVISALAGSLIIILNYFFLAVTVTLAADKAEAGDSLGGQKLMKSSYPIRLLVMAGVLILCAKSGAFDVIALVVPLLFVRPILTVKEFFRKKGNA